MTTIRLEHFTEWLASGQRGISSDAIVSQLTGRPVGHGLRPGYDHPHDPDDFRRCEILLRAYSLARLLFPTEMPARSEVWARLVADWDHIAEQMEAEVPGVFDSTPYGARCPKSYALMKRLIDGR